MPSDETAETVLNIFMEIANGAAPPRGLETTADDLAEWTSLFQVMLVHEVESSFGVSLPESLLVTPFRLEELVDAVRQGGGEG